MCSRASDAISVCPDAARTPWTCLTASAGSYCSWTVSGGSRRAPRWLGRRAWRAPIGHARAITAGVPSTTATSLTSLGTGLTPGQHGIAGYTFRNPHTKRIFSPLTWDSTTDPLAMQPMPTIFERAKSEGVSVTSVLPARFEGSGLTAVALRGGVFEGVVDEHDDAARVQQVLRAATTGDSSLVYVYERMLDHVGHGRGTASDQWVEELVRIDAFADALREQLP